MKAEAPAETSQIHLQCKVNVFTSSKVELNEADTSLRKSAAFTSVSFSGKIDSKGRVTVPARIRDKLNLCKGDTVSLELNSTKVIRKKFSDQRDALNFISRLEGLEEFSFDGEILEVILSE